MFITLYVKISDKNNQDDNNNDNHLLKSRRHFSTLNVLLSPNVVEFHISSIKNKSVYRLSVPTYNNLGFAVEVKWDTRLEMAMFAKFRGQVMTKRFYYAEKNRSPRQDAYCTNYDLSASLINNYY